MTRTDAVKKLKRLLGDKLYWRESKEASSPEARAAASYDAERLKAEYDTAKAAKDAKYRELLSDPDYVALAAKAKELHDALENARWRAMYRRVNVGTTNGMFATIWTSGDNWAEVVREVEAQQKAKASA